jgi:anti-anti-sigma factor
MTGKLKLETCLKKDVFVLSIEGGILQEHTQELQNRLEKTISEGNKKIVLDLAKCKFASSMFLTVLISTKRVLKSAGGDLKVAGVNTLMESMLAIARLKKESDIYPTLDEAVSSFLPH